MENVTIYMEIEKKINLSRLIITIYLLNMIFFRSAMFMGTPRVEGGCASRSINLIEFLRVYFLMGL